MATVHFTGNLGKDAQIRQIGQVQYTCFNVADSRRYTDRNGQTQEKTTWFSCMKRDDSGKLTPYLRKGTKVYVSGNLTMEEWTDNDGKVHKYISVMVNELEFMSAKQDEQQQNYQQPKPQPQPQRPPQNVNNLWDYATGGQQPNVQQRAPQAPQQTSEELPF